MTVLLERLPIPWSHAGWRMQPPTTICILQLLKYSAESSPCQRVWKNLFAKMGTCFGERREKGWWDPFFDAFGQRRRAGRRPRLGTLVERGLMAQPTGGMPHSSSFLCDNAPSHSSCLTCPAIPPTRPRPGHLPLHKGGEAWAAKNPPHGPRGHAEVWMNVISFAKRY